MDLNISLPLPVYCSMFQAEIINGTPFTRISIFSNSQDAIKFLSSVMNNSRIVKPSFWALQCLSCLGSWAEQYSRKPSGILFNRLNISHRLPDYCSMFQTEITNGTPFTHMSIFPCSQTAISSL